MSTVSLSLIIPSFGVSFVVSFVDKVFAIAHDKNVHSFSVPYIYLISVGQKGRLDHAPAKPDRGVARAGADMSPAPPHAPCARPRLRRSHARSALRFDPFALRAAALRVNATEAKNFLTQTSLPKLWRVLCRSIRRTRFRRTRFLTLHDCSWHPCWCCTAAIQWSQWDRSACRID